MPRTARADVGGLCYHVCSRGNAKATVFTGESDYDVFVALLLRVVRQVPVEILAWCLMPNHLHIVVRTVGDGDLGRFMHRLLTTHVRHHSIRHGSIGRIWQGRFKAFPIQQDSHLITVLRYVERNPVTATLVERVEDWPWSSARHRDEESGIGSRSELVSASPVELPRPWLPFVNTPLTVGEIDRLEECSTKARPFGGAAWTRGTSERLGLTDSLGSGRPRRRRPIGW